MFIFKKITHIYTSEYIITQKYIRTSSYIMTYIFTNIYIKDSDYSTIRVVNIDDNINSILL